MHLIGKLGLLGTLSIQRIRLVDGGSLHNGSHTQI